MYDSHTGDTDNPVRALVSDMLRKQKIARVNGNVKFYVGSVTGWCPLRSGIVTRAMTQLLGLYSPVKYVMAVAPLFEYIEVSNEVPQVVMPDTFTQGCMRCTFWYMR